MLLLLQPLLAHRISDERGVGNCHGSSWSARAASATGEVTADRCGAGRDWGWLLALRAVGECGHYCG
jgi:hypothetical protein